MKLFKIPNPYDYHEQGEYVVKAETKEEAIEKVKALRSFDESQYNYKPDFDKIEEVRGDIYKNEGCDC